MKKFGRSGERRVRRLHPSTAYELKVTLEDGGRKRRLKLRHATQPAVPKAEGEKGSPAIATDQAEPVDIEFSRFAHINFDDCQPHQLQYDGQVFTRVRITRKPIDHYHTRLGGVDGSASQVVQTLLTSLSKPMTLGGPKSLDEIDLLAAELHADAPHFRQATVKLQQHARAHVDVDKRWFGHPPLLLVGAPGSGKSQWARSVARATNLPLVVIDGAAMTSPAPLVGVDGSWKTGRPSLPLLSMHTDRRPNLICVIDEVDKLSSFGSARTSTADSVLLGLLEPTTARAFEDSFIRQPVNMGLINWILTANDLEGVSGPLRDRCVVVHIDPLKADDFEYLARRQIEQRELDPDLIGPMMRGFRTGQIKSLRRLNKLLDAAGAAMSRPMLN